MNPTNRLDTLLKERKETKEIQNQLIEKTKYDLVLNFTPFNELNLDNYLQNY